MNTKGAQQSRDGMSSRRSLAGMGTSAATPLTGLVLAGKLVFAGLVTAGQPLTVTPGFSHDVPFLVDAHNGSRSTDAESILWSQAGAQRGQFHLARSDDWYLVVATFRPL